MNPVDVQEQKSDDSSGRCECGSENCTPLSSEKEEPDAETVRTGCSCGCD